MLETSDFSMDSNTVIGCGCAACQSGQPDLVNYTQDDPLYQTNGNPPIYAPSGPSDPNTFANYLTHGFWQDTGSSERSWTQDNITFSLSNEFSADQKAGIRMAFDLWADVADIEFTEVASGANMTVLEGDDGGAWSSSTTSGTTIVSNTISIDTNPSYWTNFNDLGDYALMTAIHEIGHSLGLGHTGNYNGSADYATDAQWTDDTHQMTVMSYFNDQNVGSDHWNSSGIWQYSATPMLIDILAIQNIYGADYTTRSGDTTYGFNSNAGRDQFDFTVSDVPVAIWDGGGIDTIDLSGFSRAQTLYLTEGDFSSVGQSMDNNLVIAYGTVIENAIGGSGDDIIYGNAADNYIRGGLGNDTVHISLGNDTLDGESGNDSVVYNYSVSELAFNFIDNMTVAITHVVQAFTDFISNFENFIFSDGSYTRAELESTFAAEEFVTSFEWSGGKYFHNTTAAETTTLNASDMGYSGASGSTNLATMDRSGNELTVTLLSSSAPNVMKIVGAQSSDIITVNGTHSDVTLRIYGGDGADVITVASGVNGSDRIYGEDGDDTVNGGSGADYIWGGAGSDTLNGDSGIDKLYGGNDNDTLNGGDDRDFLYGDAGNDTLNGDGGNDVMRGGIGNDTLNGGEGYDRLYGEDGDDIIAGEGGNDRAYGGAGDDILSGGLGQDFLYGEADNDTLYGGDQADYLYGGSGIDELNGDDGNDRLYGGDDGDTLNGGAGGDFLYGENGNDTLNGGNGSDTLQAGAGDDILNGDAHNDSMYGGTGNDTLNGGSHDDLLNGEEDDDRLNGGDGSDSLYGGTGMDTLVGDAGIDFLYGGVDASVDVFGFSAAEDSQDRIYNFTLGIDQINITDLLSGYSHGSSDIDDFVLIVHTGSRFDIQVDRDGGGDSYVQTARVFTDIADSLTAQDLLDSGALIANSTLA